MLFFPLCPPYKMKKLAAILPRPKSEVVSLGLFIPFYKENLKIKNNKQQNQTIKDCAFFDFSIIWTIQTFLIAYV
ncbi:hypothetical protein N478_03230 [Pseudoalteromonas luteoviolacea S4060-1]|uniref:Uncharacterized protein n=1 Tax=Pseudoalteromonas luteoviolacea S4060-1 TaxID=1365257 RepID=A0A162CB05_9GAMM|nr:hypothetical protein N478_03230 [Pseudoalteromonas luteoviolacea S4060-1]